MILWTPSGTVSHYLALCHPDPVLAWSILCLFLYYKPVLLYPIFYTILLYILSFNISFPIISKGYSIPNLSHISFLPFYPLISYPIPSYDRQSCSLFYPLPSSIPSKSISYILSYALSYLMFYHLLFQFCILSCPILFQSHILSNTRYKAQGSFIYDSKTSCSPFMLLPKQKW